MDLVQIATIAGPTAVFTGGVAYGAIKVTLNGTKERVKTLEASHQELKSDMIDRMARIETKLDNLLTR